VRIKRQSNHPAGYCTKIISKPHVEQLSIYIGERSDLLSIGHKVVFVLVCYPRGVLFFMYWCITMWLFFNIPPSRSDYIEGYTVSSQQNIPY
jgi:hypothetical protein